MLYYLMGLAIVFLDEYNPSKIFKVASNSLEVTGAIRISHPFDCCNRGYVVLELSNSSFVCQYRYPIRGGSRRGSLGGGTHTGRGGGTHTGRGAQ